VLTVAKRYEFSTEGFNKMQLDIKKDKINLGFDIAFWGIMFGLCGFGAISGYTLIKIGACTVTSKSVKWLVRKGKI
jgi:hypothetical protein